MKFDQIIATREKKVVYRDGDLCMKVFCPGYNKADVLNEALNQARVEETELNIPRISAVTMLDGQWAIVYDYVEGKTLAQLMAEHPEKFDEYLNQFVDLQLFMHTQTCPLLTKLRDKMHRKISQTDLSATIRYELHTRLESMPRNRKLCHGDFNPSNIIVREDGQMFIIDWSHATQGNASADAARTYLLFCLNDDEITAKRYLQLFCEKNDTAIQYVQRWMPIVAASQSVKGNAAEREFLHRWIDVVDYE